LAVSIKSAIERIAIPMARAARSFTECKGWIPFGHARMEDHARERFGRTGRWLRDHAALGRAVDRLPGLADELGESGVERPLGKVAALWIGNVASAESLQAWVEMARATTVRELKVAVSKARAEGSSWPPAGGETVRDRNADASREPQAIPSSADAGERHLIRFLVPSPVRGCFDETLRLFRAVSGHEDTVTSFVESLVAEAHAGARPPDVDSVPLRSSRDPSAAERLLARCTDLWAHLPHRAGPQSQADPAVKAIAQFESLSRRAGHGDAVELDLQIRRLIELEDDLERHLGRLLCEMAGRGAWARLRFAGVRHYAEQRLGLGRTTVEGRTRIARALPRWPHLRKAYDEGRIGLETAVLLVRILGRFPADETVEKSWVERAARATVKRLRDEASALGRLELAECRDRAPGPMTDAEWHGSLELRPGGIRKRVYELGRRSEEWTHSDVFLRLRLPAELARDFIAAVDSSRRALAERVKSVPWDEAWPDPSAPPSVKAARSFSVRCRRVPAWVGLLALLEDFVDTWDVPQASSTRRSTDVYSRDGWRCTAPGCTSRRNLEDHHLRYRSRGGDKRSLDNRTCLCRFHHQKGEHGELASCRGQAPIEVVWRLGRKDVGSCFRNELRLDRQLQSD
jgi:hypothetical protein